MSADPAPEPHQLLVLLAVIVVATGLSLVAFTICALARAVAG